MNSISFKKDDTLIVKGVAIILMVCNHLFPIPEWIYPENQYVSFMIKGKSIAAYLGAGSKVCVAIFAFLSGVGLFFIYKKSTIKNGYVQTLKRLKPFYFTYWVILTVVYIPLMYLCGVFKFDLIEFVANYLGYQTTYCKIAWYVRFYLELIITFPIYIYIYNYLKKIIKKEFLSFSVLLIVVYGGAIILTFLPENRIHFLIEEYLNYVPIVLLGYFFVEENVFQNIIKIVSGLHRTVIAIVCVMVFGISFIARGVIKQFFMVVNLDLIYAPLIVLSVWIFTTVCFKKANKVLKILGKYSLEIWFLHAIFFIGNSIVQSICYWPKIDILILAWTLIILLPISKMISIVTKYLVVIHPIKALKDLFKIN